MTLHYPIVVIGAGAGGLVAAFGAAKAKKKVLLVEKGNYGGDCTNFGCIPSKSLIAAANAAHYLKNAGQWGILNCLKTVDASGALERTRGIVKEIRAHEDPAALKRAGVDALTGIASFIDPHSVSVKLDDGTMQTVKAKKFVIATGSHPFIPPIKGLEQCRYLTNETVFKLASIPKRLGIIGGGPIGCELAQAFQRLGARVTLIQHASRLLKKEEIEAEDIVENVLRREGIDLKLFCEPQEVIKKNGKLKIVIVNKRNKKKEIVQVDELLVAVGRRPSIEALNLQAIGVSTCEKGIIVDDYGRTNQKHIFAVGDVTGRALFTHVAENEARTVLANLLLPWPIKFSLDKSQAIPRVTYTDPEVAAAGLSEEAAKNRWGTKKLAIYTVPFSEVDRAKTTGRTEGFVKITTKKWSGKILGTTIVAPRAGEMISEVTTAMHARIPLRKLSSLIHPYPTYNLAIRKAADQWLTKTLLASLF